MIKDRGNPQKSDVPGGARGDGAEQFDRRIEIGAMISTVCMSILDITTADTSRCCKSLPERESC